MRALMSSIVDDFELRQANFCSCKVDTHMDCVIPPALQSAVALWGYKRPLVKHNMCHRFNGAKLRSSLTAFHSDCEGPAGV